MVFVESNQNWLSADGWWGVHSVPGNYIQYAVTSCMGAQWLSGRVLDLRPRSSGFEPHRITALCP